MRLSLSVTAALLGFGALALSIPASATPFGGAMSNSLPQVQAGQDSLLVQVQHRSRSGHGGSHGGSHGGGHSSHGGRGGSPHGHYRGGHNYGHRHGSSDGAVAAGILGGLFLGAIIANQAQHNQSVQYCMQRFRSYDPNSGTYLGLDGRRHSCP
jgi:hypothetical protein